MMRVILSVVGLLVLANAATASPRVTLTPTTIKPGEFFIITIEPAAGETVQEVNASVNDIRPMFNPFGGKWKAVAAVSAKTKPGGYSVYLKMKLGDGTIRDEKLSLQVAAKSFPTQRIRMSSDKMKMRTEEALARDKAKLDQAVSESASQPLWEGNFIQPVQGRISTPYGAIRTVNGQETGRHLGVDVAAPSGTPIKATNHGRVVLAEMLETHGNTLIIDHGCGVFSLYLHLSKFEVRVGDEVKKGQTVGRVGTTGFSTGPHLHWTMRVGEIATNPWSWTKAPPKL